MRVDIRRLQLCDCALVNVLVGLLGGFLRGSGKGRQQQSQDEGTA